MDSTTDHRSTSRRRRSSASLHALRLAPLLVLSVALMLVAPARSAPPKNKKPTASFTASPSAPVAGERVTFTSTSNDPDGSIVSQAWDLDNDGLYDDGTATTASRTFAVAGTYTVRLRVEDNDRASAEKFVSVVVKANGAPVAAFTAAPTSPETGQTVTLSSTSSDPDGRPLTQEWDLDADGAYDDATGATAGVSFGENGTRRVSLRVTDSGGTVRTTFRDIAVQNRRPVAAFGVSAAEVDTGTAITFTSGSTDPDGTVASHRWDFDGDGVTDATGATVSASFADNGTPTVSLSVTDDDGDTGSVSRQVTIRNRAPSGAFTYAPTDPVAGDPVRLRSTATDSDGSVIERSWDLDGDGVYDDATGTEVSTRFADGGEHTVGLQVIDDDGEAGAPDVQRIDVANRPVLPSSVPFPPTVVNGAQPPNATLVAPRLLDPFPRVRIRGVTTRRGARLDLLHVSIPGGSKVLVRCRGRGCPPARKTKGLRFGPGRPNRLHVVSMPGFRRRHLRAGTVLEVFVTKKGMIGKYTRIRIRRMKPPLRVDSCTVPGVARARRCPGR